MNKDLDWDSHLSNKLQKEWQNIVKQVKNCPVMEINRSCGPRSGSYDLICFTDASKNLYGCVLYLRNVSTKEVTFIQAKNKVISEQLKSKTMPVLELVAMQFGVQSLMDTYNELQNAVRPISITSLKLFSDSTISLSWVEALVSRFEKMRGRSVFVMNKLESIRKLCQTHSVEFCFISGSENPADYTTREVSGRVLSRTCYHTGPPFLESEDNFHNVLVPNPVETFVCQGLSGNVALPMHHLKSIFSIEKFSSYNKAVAVLKHCFEFINNLKLKLKTKDPLKYDHLRTIDYSADNFHNQSCFYLIREAQKVSFPEVFKYFSEKPHRKRDIPDLASKLNLFVDQNGLIRVKSKMNNLT